MKKSGEPVYLPIPEDLKLVLNALAQPLNTPQGCPCFLWNGCTHRAVVGIAERRLMTRPHARRRSEGAHRLWQTRFGASCPSLQLRRIGYEKNLVLTDSHLAG